MIESVAQLRKGLDLLPSVADITVRREHELSLQIALGKALIAIKGWSAPEVGQAFACARALCEQLDRPQLLRSILEGQWVFRFTRGELEESEHHAGEIRELGEARNDVRVRCLGVECHWLRQLYLQCRSTLFPQL